MNCSIPQSILLISVARRTFRKAVEAVQAANRMRRMTQHDSEMSIDSEDELNEAAASSKKRITTGGDTTASGPAATEEHENHSVKKVKSKKTDS